MRRNVTMMILALLIYVLIIPVQTTGFEQDTVIEFLLRKVQELETNQQECSSYQRRMLLELNNVREKLEQSERRISELEAIVYDMKTDENTQNEHFTKENDPVDYPANKDAARVILEEKNISLTPEPEAMHSHKRGIFRRESRAIAPKQIAFCATIVNGIESVQDKAIVRFDTVLHDEGNGFSKETGIFTCPLSGTYFFSASVMTRPAFKGDVHLIVNGKVKGNSFSFGSGSYDQGSISNIVRCEAGYNVWISAYGDTSELFGDYYTSFSGFLLWGDATGSR